MSEAALLGAVEPSARARTGPGLRVGIVCPYSFDRPGGVQNHVLGLAASLRGLGHAPAILAPGELDAATEPGVPATTFTSSGPALPVPYNGSIARVSFGPLTAGRVRRWLRDGEFDLVHLHEPITPSISLLALKHAEVPVVATYHTATPRSRTMQLAGDALRRLIEKIDAGIAVSEPARDVVVRHQGRDAVVIPNGFDQASFRPAPRTERWRGGDRPRITFLGRLDEPRKGLAVLLAAVPAIRAAVGEVEVCLAGHGVAPPVTRTLPGVRLLGGVSEQRKRELLAATDVFVAPQVARESFGIVVLEALAAGAEVVASDLPAFVDLLARSPKAPLGALFRRGDPADLSAQVAAVLRDGVRRQPAAGQLTARYDWARVAPSVADVYAAVVTPGDTWRTLDQALIRRARRALEVVGVDPAEPSRRVHRAAAAVLVAAADGASVPHRERLESDLSRWLSATGLVGSQWELQSEHDRVTLARRLHNDVVAGAIRGRRSDGTALRAFEMAES